ncbi:carbohydrate ABC transporter permease [Enterococcus casseliflavus]|uniref:ABC transporter permease subunit n=1 Tax=Enterococcus casseliflavus TaxID=37734 RepID=A0ABD6Z0N4_ENTCA|nr:sugar ABC transporter permease [Enterococcus casseliflavus]MBE9879702.1 sugar ABC transporter permease [Enterococcus casseliflavus]MCD5161732.1 sugar ABC transporter permease [Enterococcus casseliflavus]MCD5190353.1 sugar ABC transporter permease [Enterococcus casseliflavus]MDT2962287.1 sugar ABC transporter permease [Enterococcus casseliflavus]MDT2974498.1 sugar ABC transporter permease [Enterococcus casseliflavus]
MEITSKSKAVNKLKRKNTLTALSFIAPNFIGFFLFTLVPVVFSLILAFMEWDSFSSPEFVGMKNFSKMLGDDTFWISLKNTFLYTIGVVPLTLVCSLGLAILLNKKVRGMKFFRTAFFFPYVTSLVAIAVVWNMLFHPTMGPINQFLKFFIENPPGWTSSSDWALTAIIIVSVWRGMGYYMILYLAGLQSVPKELYEAASIDGANKWQQFRNVTLPSLRPTTFFVSIMLVINCFKIFDLVQVMTAGGPGRATNVLVYQIYNEAFVKFNFGYASAIAMVLFVIVLGITVIQFKWNQRQERV